MGLGAGGDEVVSGVDPLPVDIERGPVDEGGAALDELEAVLGGEVDVLLLSHRLDDLALAGDQRGEVDRARVGGDPREPALPRPMARLGRGQQRLGRDAANVHARAADGAALDHRQAQVQAPRGDGGRERSAAGPDDDQVVRRHSAALGVDPAAGGDVIGVVLQQRACETEQLGDALVGDPVVHGWVLAAGVDEAAPAQAGEMVGDLGLRLAELLDKLTDRQLVVLLEQLEDAHASGIAERAKVLADQLRLGRRLGERERSPCCISHC